ncbi:hypothetical protein QP150_13055 [Sphingomonas sp. 22L2VL55-3]
MLAQRVPPVASNALSGGVPRLTTATMIDPPIRISASRAGTITPR